MYTGTSISPVWALRALHLILWAPIPDLTGGAIACRPSGPARFALILILYCSVTFGTALKAQEIPALTDEELGTAQQQALLLALAGDPYNHRGADHCQAGCAMLVRRHAIPSNTRNYSGYWVGGGLPTKGDKPQLQEGTFGWDYFGLVFNKRIALRWSHGRLYQGGAGAYQTDGPLLHK